MRKFNNSYPSGVLFYLSVIFIIVFSGWTISENITFFINQGLFVNLLIALVFWAGFALIFMYLPKTYKKKADVAEISRPIWTSTHTYLGIAFLVGFGIAYFSKNLLLYWITGSTTILGLIILEIKNKKSELSPEITKEKQIESRLQLVALFLIIIGVVIFGYFANRPDKDDTYYLGVAARAAEAPFTAYSRDNPSFPPGTVENIYPMNEWIGYLQFIGLISWLTDTQPIETVSYIFALFGAAYIVIAYGLLYQKIFPKHWLLVLSMTVIILLIDGSYHRGPANFAFVRIWQGKAMLYHILRPLILYFGIEFGERPTSRNFFILFLTNVVGVGLTPISIWMAPVFTAGGVLTGVFISQKSSIKTLLLGVLSCIYPLFVGVISFQEELISHNSKPLSFDTWLDGLSRSFISADNNYFWWYAGFLILFLFIAPTKRSRTLGLATGGIFFIIFMNPLFAPAIAQYVIRPGLYWRTIFLILIVPSTAWILSYPVSKTIKLLKEKINNNLKMRRDPRTEINGNSDSYPQDFSFKFDPTLLPSLLIFMIMILLFTILIPSKYITDPENRNIWFGSPGINAPQHEFQLLADIYSSLEPGTYIIAPYEMSWLLPTIKGGYWPVVLRPTELNIIKNIPNFPEREIFLRDYMFQYVYNRTNLNAELVEETIDYFNVNKFIIGVKKFLPGRNVNNLVKLEKTLLILGFENCESEMNEFRCWEKIKRIQDE